MGELDAERHRVVSLTDRRTVALMTMSSALIASATVEVDVELLVDRERERLRDALERAGEHDRGAELAEPSREGERSAGAEPAARERKHRRAGRRVLGPAPSVRAAAGSVGSTASNAEIAVRR